jgi:L-alanine-DL-glutamate epimerase-like enolase superfamily enzyme
MRVAPFLRTARRSFTAQAEAVKITKISLYKVGLPLHEGSYKWSGGNQVVEFDATVVKISTNIGVEGVGECTPLGPAYLPAYAEGVRTGIQVLAPTLLGENPTRLNAINQVMDNALRGHPYVKSALDMACWDIMGKMCNMPVCELLGGRFGENYKLYRAISQDTPQRMAENVKSYVGQGYRCALRYSPENGLCLMGIAR